MRILYSLLLALAFGFFWPFFEPVVFPPREVCSTSWRRVWSRQWGRSGRRPSSSSEFQRPAVTLTMEPVFVALFGYWLAGDRLVALQVFGAVLILSALLVCELLPVIMSRSKQTYKKGDVL